MKRHAGRYPSKKRADQYADFMRTHFHLKVEVVPVIEYDVIEGEDDPDS